MAKLRAECPKCSSEGAWYETNHNEVWLRCLCGYAKVVESRGPDGIVITHTPAREHLVLPRRNSKLYDCFAALIGLRKGTTAQITKHVNEGLSKRKRRSSSDIASQLTVLRLKGLAVVVEEHKGLPGGSTWAPTDAALAAVKGN